MFSRWAIKRVCKFLLKKRLGKFILGDIDLNQLDVQLSDGKIQLSDIALNVDYINQKFGTAAVLVKEGSVGSLVVTMPWTDGGCRIEVDELEVVVNPCSVKVSRDEFGNCSRSKNGNNSFGKLDNEAVNSGAANASVDAHEGVKTIAKMVKWLLTSFHVKIKKLIVAFDPLLEEESKKRLERILVLRISEIECGIHISEDDSTSSFTTAQHILGLSRLTSFVKFQGVALELLHVDGLNHQTPSQHSTETNSGNWFSGYCSTDNMTTIIAGEKGGFSGNFKFAIPWKNGSLDIRKLDADLHIEPLELRLQPSTIKCFLLMWDLFQDIGEKSEDQGHGGPSNSSSAPHSCALPSEEELLGNEGFATSCYLMEKEPVNNLLSESHIISDWVSRSLEDGNAEEPDFAASVDQFFECFDGLRNSQSALGNSGMWNWTYSVFSAINAASNLASESLHVPSEPQNVETKFNATISKVSLLFSFFDKDHQQSPKMKDDKANADIHIHCLCVQFVDILLVSQYCTSNIKISQGQQVRPREMNFEVIVHHVQLVDHLCLKNELVGSGEHGRISNSESDITLIRKMQDGVQGALQTFQESNKDPVIDNQVYYSVDISLSTQDIDKCCHMTNDKDICWKDTSITLLKTSGVSWCHVTVNSDSSGGSLMCPIYMSLKLPPVVFWVNFDLITMMLEFLKDIANYIETTRSASGFTPESETKKYRFSPLADQEQIPNPRATTAPAKTTLQSNIFLPNARIILCFPLKERTDLSGYSCNQFIAFEFISPTGRNVRSANPIPIESSKKRHAVDTSCSLHLNLGDFYLFSISSASTEKSLGSGTFSWQETSFSVEKIISAANGTGHLSPVSMFWQDGAVTGPWIAKKAKILASSENVGSEEGVRRGCEFASVTAVKDITDYAARNQQEILSSSAFFLRAQLHPVTVNLGKSQYENLCRLLIQMFEHFSCIETDSVRTREKQSASQASILVECDSVTVSVAIEPLGDVKCSMLKELPGSWLNLTLQVNKIELLCASNIGGIRSANFLWVTHGQGNLWGSITEGQQREFLLISCSDSTVGRGNGEGSNVLSSRYSGSDIVNLWDPHSNQNYSSISVRSASIVAKGGRLDWFNTILSFFSLPSSGFEQAGDTSLEKTCGSSFILNLVDVGLSYEPYFKTLVADDGLDPNLFHLNASEATGELYVACLFAASSLKLSSTTVVNSRAVEYKITLQDLGFLIAPVSESNLVGSTYSVEHLSKIGYVKVAQEAHIEALLKTNCKNGHLWELECAESQIMLSTCHDTTFGLIRLASQLQKLFAPDMQNYVVHMESRRNTVQQVNDEVCPSVSQMHTSSADKRSKGGNLMDEVCEDVFQLYETFDGQTNIISRSHSSLGGSGASSSEEKIPEFIEEYFLSDLRPLSELVLKSQSSHIIDRKIADVGESRLGNGGWYADNSFKILENHVSKVDGQNNVGQLVKVEATTSDSKYVGVGKAEGCILLKNMNVIWRIYGGSDWSNFQNTSQSSSITCGRDPTVCLELILSGIGVDYEVYPDGEVCASSLSLTVQDFCLNDRSDHAPWKLVLGYYQSKKHPRKSSSKAVKLNLEAVKPDPSVPLEENRFFKALFLSWLYLLTRLRIALLPIRLHLHQSQLDFLISFFGGKSSSADPPPCTPLGLGKSGDPTETNDNLQGCAVCEEAFLTYFQARLMITLSSLNLIHSSFFVFLQKFDIWPLLIRVDYIPYRVDLAALRDGKYVELVNLVPWKVILLLVFLNPGVELQLKHVQGVGLYGWNSVCETILGEWLEDISQNQIHKLLKGLPPIKSLVAVGSGAAKLVSFPLKNYKKDQRLLKGMHRGTIAFLRSISVEAIGSGVHLAAGAHNILLQAEYLLTSIPPSVPWPEESRLATNVRANQPKDAQQGIQQAYQSISDGLGKTASALVQSPLKRYQRGAGMGSALASVVQAAPGAAIAPASAAARAVHCALLGFRNSLDPERKRESMEKYTGKIPPQESMH
ncbi:hypothetical protein RD792_006586 [Penstemon davidsonii]|uniref:Autophagy-related protein 2 n=1 Tax=Penstemon davidsonii TaxID=160366 RepID=A0ABR0DWS6_9LAMI|nr:hypothetical protein RD792_006586 [Penstemon davidsonii]